MKLKIVLLCLIVSCGSVYAGNNSNLSIQTSYILPIENTDFNSSMTIGAGTKFWGIFEFTAHGYLEVAANGAHIIDRVRAPELFSAGIGINIPMGGFYLKGDYQRFFKINNNQSDVLSLAKYSDSYKLGIGLDISEMLEIELYTRRFMSDFFTLYDQQDGFIGVGVNFKL